MYQVNPHNPYIILPPLITSDTNIEPFQLCATIRLAFPIESLPVFKHVSPKILQ